MNLLLHKSSSSRSFFDDFVGEEFFALIDEYLLLDTFDTVLIELLRLSPLFSFANRLLILSN